MFMSRAGVRGVRKGNHAVAFSAGQCAFSENQNGLNPLIVFMCSSVRRNLSICAYVCNFNSIDTNTLEHYQGLRCSLGF